MRQIKFRAWDGTKMLDEIRLTAAHGIRIVSSSDLAQRDVSDDAYVFMQCTGLNDRNGREIYEGDVVNWEGVDGDETQAIVWSDFDARFVVQDPEGGQYGFNFQEAGKRMQVTGNIYENPELLN